MAEYLIYSSGDISKFISVLEILSDEVAPPDNIKSNININPPYDNVAPFYVVYNIPLTSNQETQLANIISRVNDSIVDYGQLGQIRSDIIAAKDVLTTFYNLPSPTQAQTLAAVKKMIEVLNLFLRLFIIILDYIRFNR